MNPGVDGRGRFGSGPLGGGEQGGEGKDSVALVVELANMMLCEAASLGSIPAAVWNIKIMSTTKRTAL